MRNWSNRNRVIWSTQTQQLAAGVSCAHALIGIFLLWDAGRASDTHIHKITHTTVEGRGGMGEAQTSGEKSGDEAKGIDQREGASVNEGEQDREIQAVSERQLEGWVSNGEAEEDKSRGIQRGTRRNPPMRSLMVQPSGWGRWQEVWGWIDPIPQTGVENFLSLRKNGWRVKKSGEDRRKVGARVSERASELKREREKKVKRRLKGENS